jgi:hypothetical protein
MKIDNITLQKIKDAASIVDVIGDFETLHKRGTTYQALCPFHTDHHLGSFIINPRRNTYTCYACGAHGDAIEFLMRHEKLTFFEAVSWLGKKYGIEVEGSDNFHPRAAKPRPMVAQLPKLELPISMVSARLDTRNDTLCNWLRALPWNSEQKARIESTLKQYGVGHARQGYTIFWQIDDKGHVRTGKFMLYKKDGHRDKTTPYNFTWAHTLLSKAGRIDMNTHDLDTTLFGMHLLSFHPDADINIVESEKTALLASIMWGNPDKWIWMASGGLSMLSRQRLQPIINQGRHIVLYPDRDGIESWKQQALLIGYRNLEVSTQYVTKYWRDKDGQKADIGDVIVASLSENRTAPAQPVYQQPRHPAPPLPIDIPLREAMNALLQSNPNIQLLTDKFKLQAVKLTHYGTTK